MSTTKCLRLALALGAVLFASAAIGQDQDSDPDTDAENSGSGSDEWTFGASIYGWFPDISGRTRFTEGPGGGDIDVPIGDILDNLEFTFQGAFVANKGRWGIYTDLVYLDLSKSQSVSEQGTIGPIELPEDVTGTAALDLTSWIVTAAGSYRLGDSGDGRTIDLIFGTRYTDVSQTLALDLQGDLGDTPLPEGSNSFRVSQDLWDLVVGLRGRIAWTSDGAWFTPYYIDVGTGDSDLTWQGLIGVGYSFNWGDVVLALRHLDYSLDSESAIDDISFSGPALGAVFRF